jgi:hypothetical protein
MFAAKEFERVERSAGARLKEVEARQAELLAERERLAKLSSELERRAEATARAAAPSPAASHAALDALRLDGGTQPRLELDEATLDEYAGRMIWDDASAQVLDPEGLAWEPVTVFDDGDDVWLADGFHRVHAARRAGHEKIQARVLQGTRRDAVAHSLGANATHGKRRTNDDKRRAVSRALADPDWCVLSNNAIAKMCKVTHPFVAKVRRELESSGDIEQVTVRKAADGSSFDAAALSDAQRKGHARRKPSAKKTTDARAATTLASVCSQTRDVDALHAELTALPSPPERVVLFWSASEPIPFGAIARLDAALTTMGLQPAPWARSSDEGDLALAWGPGGAVSGARADVLMDIDAMEHARVL